jgi:hypothetical protein
MSRGFDDYFCKFHAFLSVRLTRRAFFDKITARKAITEQSYEPSER